MKAGKVRLYVDHALGEGQSVPLSRDQGHYLASVMRLGDGDAVTVFNGRDGAWRAVLGDVSRKGGVAVCDVQTAPQLDPPDLWLMFAPLKKAQTEYVVQKAVEMGARRIVPVVTAFTNSERFNAARAAAHVVEAAEQCGATYVPEVAELARLDAILDVWPAGRRLMFCDEARAGEAAATPEDGGPWAVLIGPEGGFSEIERARLGGMGYVMSLGPRILRAETASVAAMALWQAALGDWRGRG
ncbi:MAG: 16S rRNA (uracil(1498)-N(3))-methyltransferase [Pseudomonadota bacterium]